MMQLGKFFDRINNNKNNNEYVYGENLTIDNKLSLRMKNEEHFDKIDTNYHVKYKNTSVYDNNEINIIKTTKKQNKVQQKLMKNNRTTIETSTIIPRQDFESLVSYGNFNTSINSEKESPLDTSIHSSSNGKLVQYNTLSALHCFCKVDDPFQRMQCNEIFLTLYAPLFT